MYVEYLYAVYSDEYPLPDSFELKSFMLTLVCLQPSYSLWTENPSQESYLLKRNCPFYYLNKNFMLTHVYFPFIGVRLVGWK